MDAPTLRLNTSFISFCPTAMSIPTHQKALFIKAKQGNWEVSTTDVPKLGPGELLVKVESTALNPVDWKIHDYGLFITEYPAILGFDSAGVVAAIGEGVDGFAVGDQVYVLTVVHHEIICFINSAATELLHFVFLVRLHFGTPTKRLATFQQYVIIDHPEVAVKVYLFLQMSLGSFDNDGYNRSLATLHSIKLPLFPPASQPQG